jgi:hypothetical protein
VHLKRDDTFLLRFVMLSAPHSRSAQQIEQRFGSTA